MSEPGFEGYKNPLPNMQLGMCFYCRYASDKGCPEYDRLWQYAKDNPKTYVGCTMREYND